MASSLDDWHAISSDAKFKKYDGCVVYIPDVTIKLAWGYEWRKDFFEPWFNNFPDKSPSAAAYVDIFYNEMLMYRIPFVFIDGYRHCMPLGRYRPDFKLEVTREECKFFAMVNQLNMRGYNSEYFEDVVRQAKFEIVDKPWLPAKLLKRAPARGKKKVKES